MYITALFTSDGQSSFIENFIEVIVDSHAVVRTNTERFHVP